MRAQELRFGEVPDVDVRFTGSQGRESVSESSRSRLPDRVEDSVDYTDVEVDYTLATRLTGDAARSPDPPRGR
ncbi:hypothetical protein [Streptomyces sp. 8N706]|uniref:hypothetical protein n=1 Tax=Streptomyces sp. 8N706 TaxID=3457416 RepID=UPI003FD0ACE6